MCTARDKNITWPPRYALSNGVAIKEQSEPRLHRQFQTLTACLIWTMTSRRCCCCSASVLTNYPTSDCERFDHWAVCRFALNQFHGWFASCGTLTSRRRCCDDSTVRFGWLGCCSCWGRVCSQIVSGLVTAAEPYFVAKTARIIAQESLCIQAWHVKISAVLKLLCATTNYYTCGCSTFYFTVFGKSQISKSSFK